MRNKCCAAPGCAAPGHAANKSPRKDENEETMKVVIDSLAQSMSKRERENTKREGMQREREREEIDDRNS
jgi:hypothetical protein